MSGRGDKKNAVGQKGLWCKKKKKKSSILCFFSFFCLLSFYQSLNPLAHWRFIFILSLLFMPFLSTLQTLISARGLRSWMSNLSISHVLFI